jgi:hypothetical protein
MSQFGLLAVVLLALSLMLSAVSCGSRADGNVTPPPPANSSAENANGVKTNAEELSLLINMPYEAEDVFFKEDKADNRLTAVLRFDKVDTDKLASDLEKTGSAADATIETEALFHPELRSQSEMRGDVALNGKSYTAVPFFSAPYNEGTITRIDGTDFFVLELTAK